MNLYHITSREAWIEATRRGSYRAASLEAEGFIHCSTAAQVLPVARQFYGGQRGLVLLVIEPRRLEAEVRWERSNAPEGVPEEASFPHVYGEINLEAVVQTLDFEPDVRGEFALPALPSEAGPGSSRQDDR